MTNEKDFGKMISADEPTIMDAEDLLRLQQPGLHGAVEQCTVCTYTCNSVTSVIE